MTYECLPPVELTEITPEKYKCDVDASCPAIFKAGDSCIIIGKIARSEKCAMLEERMGNDEIAIEVPFNFIKDIIMPE